MKFGYGFQRRWAKGMEFARAPCVDLVTDPQTLTLNVKTVQSISSKGRYEDRYLCPYIQNQADRNMCMRMVPTNALSL